MRLADAVGLFLLAAIFLTQGVQRLPDWALLGVAIVAFLTLLLSGAVIVYTITVNCSRLLAWFSG
ncbi:hypothetical protein [Halomicrobium zhouii]|nr:hypothetical protein [Halomicrobium zhouii]